jgi:hypothetical protein
LGSNRRFDRVPGGDEQSRSECHLPKLRSLLKDACWSAGADTDPMHWCGEVASCIRIEKLAKLGMAAMTDTSRPQNDCEICINLFLIINDA